MKNIIKAPCNNCSRVIKIEVDYHNANILDESIVLCNHCLKQDSDEVHKLRVEYNLTDDFLISIGVRTDLLKDTGKI